MTMPAAGFTLEQAKAARNEAHAAFQAQLLQVQEDLAVRGIGSRIADRAGEVAADAAEIARENKGVVAGTMAALAVWFLRGPIIAVICRFWSDDDQDEDERNVDDE